jgi:NAD dependent epimerase/dehydratase
LPSWPLRVDRQEKPKKVGDKTMTVLVTGAGGFIGSHLVEALLRKGHAVRALVRYNSRARWGYLEDLGLDFKKRLDIHLGDVTDPYFVRGLLDECEVVFHLAALIGIPYSYYAPASYVSTNVAGTLNILEAGRQCKPRRIIVTSTSEVYGTARYTPIDESHPLQAQSPYAASKIAADKLAESYFCSFDLPVVTLRPFNTYGPRQSARAVIPTVLTQALVERDEIHLGNLGPRRDLTFVEDTVHAFLLAAETPNIDGEIIHFGQGEAFSVEEVARRCLAIVGSQARIESTTERRRPEKSEVGVLMCDATKARRLLGWKPKVSLEEGLRRTSDYLRDNVHRYRPDNYAL